MPKTAPSIGVSSVQTWELVKTLHRETKIHMAPSTVICTVLLVVCMLLFLGFVFVFLVCLFCFVLFWWWWWFEKCSLVAQADWPIHYVAVTG